MSHVALAWLSRRVAAPIIGFSSVERIDDALAARGKLLTEEEEAYLEELYQPQEVLGHASGLATLDLHFFPSLRYTYLSVAGIIYVNMV
jgi:diketogulonate reductase-like aldo/keto reductase